MPEFLVSIVGAIQKSGKNLGLWWRWRHGISWSPWSTSIYEYYQNVEEIGHIFAWSVFTQIVIALMKGAQGIQIINNRLPEPFCPSTLRGIF
jgi:hypothetical protein